jgi:hypothetical protein
MAGWGPPRRALRAAAPSPRSPPPIAAAAALHTSDGDARALLVGVGRREGRGRGGSCGAACDNAQDAPDGSKLAFGRVRRAGGGDDGGEEAEAVAAPMGRLLRGRVWLH